MSPRLRFWNRNIGKFLDAPHPTSQRHDVESWWADAASAVSLLSRAASSEGSMSRRLQRSKMPKFQGIVTVDAAIDQPDVDALAIGVDANLSLATIGFHRGRNDCS